MTSEVTKQKRVKTKIKNLKKRQKKQRRPKKESTVVPHSDLTLGVVTQQESGEESGEESWTQDTRT